MSDRRGLIQVYTGNGKGKTTAAFGQALRAVGHGWRVAVVQFLKQQETGEVVAARDSLPELRIERFGTPEFIIGREPSDEERDRIAQGLQVSRCLLAGGEYDLVVLDEISHVTNLKLATVDEVLTLLDGKAAGTEVVLTGRDMPEALVHRADLVTNMVAVKHPFESGVGSRPGIEY